jgi:DNA repair protein RadD
MGGEASIYSASFNTKEFGKITYATIGSIKKLGETFKELGYEHVIIDEVHLFPREADSMLGKFLKDAQITKVLGFTASPFKLQTNLDVFSGTSYSKLVMLTNKSKKGNFFKEILHVTQIKEMLDRGYWSKLRYEIYDFDTGLLVYNSTKAEFTEESIQKAYEDQNIHTKIIRKIQETDRKSILVFVPSVNEAIILSRAVPNSAAVYADMDKKDRDKIITDFKAGKIRVIFNVNILSVGFDHPLVDMIICGRPTASLAWWYQAAGRGTRIHSLKQDCLIVDFVGNSDKFGKIEDLYYKNERGYWKLYGTGGKLLTGVPIHDIGNVVDPATLKTGESKLDFGKHKGKMIKEVPLDYLRWMLGPDYQFNRRNEHLRAEIEAVIAATSTPVAK